MEAPSIESARQVVQTQAVSMQGIAASSEQLVNDMLASGMGNDQATMSAVANAQELTAQAAAAWQAACEGLAAHAQGEEYASSGIAAKTGYLRGGPDARLPAPSAGPAPGRPLTTAPTATEPPGYSLDYRNPGTAAEDAAMRQAVRNRDYDLAVRHLQRMDRLEKQAGVSEGEGMRPKIARTVTMMKAAKRAEQREARELPKHRERHAGKIATTASEVITANSRYTMTTPEQAERVKASLESAADSLRAGDHAGALRHLAEAKEAARGPEGTSVLTGGPDGRSAVHRITDHETAVQVLIGRMENLARYAPSAPSLSAGPRPAG